jgi:hypothetical protein
LPDAKDRGEKTWHANPQKHRLLPRSGTIDDWTRSRGAKDVGAVVRRAA